MNNQLELDKYEGHRQPWVFTAGVSYPMSKADMALRHDAPLLLAEVKRLRKGVKDMLYRLEMEERDAGHAEQELEQWIDTWKHWLKEMIE